MGACASKFKGFKDDVPPPVEKEEVAVASRDVKIVEATVNKDEAAAAKEVKLVEETVSKDEVPAAEDGEAKPRSLGHLLKEIEQGEKGSVENGNATSPESVAADAEAVGKAEKAPPATEDINPEEKNVEEEDVKPDSENVGADKETEQKSLTETEKKKIEEETTVTTTLETPTEDMKLEAKNAESEKKIEENKFAEDTKIETPGKVEEDDKQVVEPTKTDNHVENNKAVEVKTDERKPVSDAEKTKDGEDETKN